MKRFHDRREAGRLLARSLTRYRGNPNIIVIALPRGGVPVGYEVAHELDAPLDVLSVRKIGAPGQEEYALGAIASGGARVLDTRAVRHLGVTDDELREIETREMAELQRRETLYRGEAPPLALKNKIAIIVDDGLATGSTMEAAIIAIAKLEPEQIVIAAPVASRDVCERLENRYPYLSCICRTLPEPLMAIGLSYDDFSSTSDEEVLALLERRKLELEAGASSAHRPLFSADWTDSHADSVERPNRGSHRH